MKASFVIWTVALLCFIQNTALVARADSAGGAATTSEAGANAVVIPKQILKTGVSLTDHTLSPNSVQLANTIGLMSILERMQSLRARVDSAGSAPTLESLSARQDLWDASQKASLIIQKTDLEVDFACAEMCAELQVYNEILATFTGKRDTALARTNAGSFIANGILWAVCESLTIPTYKFPKYAIPSGIIGIPAGVIPSIMSLYTFRQINGPKMTSEAEPNMLAKIFGYPITCCCDYPRSVWEFLNQVPANAPASKSRRDQLIDRWITDSNIPSFSNRHSKQQLDILTASVCQRNGLSIATLSARQVMLQQLSAEVLKMKQMLLELTMAVQGDKQLTAMEPGIDDSAAHIAAGMVP